MHTVPCLESVGLLVVFFFFFLILSTTQIGVNKSFNDETNISNYTELTSYQGYTK